MSKYLIETVKLEKRVFIVEAYSPEEAIEVGKTQFPVDSFELGEKIFRLEGISEYEYNKDWKEQIERDKETLA